MVEIKLKDFVIIILLGILVFILAREKYVSDKIGVLEHEKLRVKIELTQYDNKLRQIIIEQAEKDEVIEKIISESKLLLLKNDSLISESKRIENEKILIRSNDNIDSLKKYLSKYKY